MTVSAFLKRKCLHSRFSHYNKAAHKPEADGKSEAPGPGRSAAWRTDTFFLPKKKINCSIELTERFRIGVLDLLYTKIAKPLLFRLDPEIAHRLTIGFMRAATVARLLDKMYGVPRAPELAVDVCGLSFPSPVGLAAGLDKNAEAVRAFSSLGFGFVEVGTVTPRPQPGNERPRLFRLPEHEALINRMGFNNAGAEAVAANLRETGALRIPVGVNIGKNKATPNDRAEDDYRACVGALYPYGDFFVVNVSSPNTPDLRNLQHGDSLGRLIAAVVDETDRQRERHGGPAKPVFVKIAPDVTDEQLAAMAETIAQSRASGMIAANTTVSREGVTHPRAGETGGLSGRPLAARSTEVIRSLYRLTGGKLPIIGCGGIFSAADAYEKIRAGACLVEVYTALIYKGPELLRELNAGLVDLLKRDGWTHVSQAVGADHRR